MWCWGLLTSTCMPSTASPSENSPFPPSVSLTPPTNRKRVWSLKMPDSVLAIQSSDDWSVFAALADGFVAVLQVSGATWNQLNSELMCSECDSGASRESSSPGAHWIWGSNLPGAGVRPGTMVWLWECHHNPLLTVSVTSLAYTLCVRPHVL